MGGQRCVGGTVNLLLQSLVMRGGGAPATTLIANISDNILLDLEWCFIDKIHA
jgi:hypothetical protein